MCAIAARAHISRFGQYTLDLSRTPRPVDYELPILSTVTADDRPAPASTKAKAVRSGCGAAKRRAGRIGDPQGVLELLWLLLTTILAWVRPRQDLVLENLLLRHQ